MSAMAVLTNGYSLNPSKPTSTPINRHVKYGSSFSFPRRYSFENISSISTSRLFRSSSLRLRCIRKDVDHYEAPRPKDNAEEEDNVAESFVDKNTEGANWESSLLAKLAVVLGIAAIFTVISIRLKPPGLGSLLGVQRFPEGSSSSLAVASSASFTFKAFGYNFVLPQYAPGWVYFWLLMAAACGLFISEEALNIWVCALCWLAYLWHGCFHWMVHGHLLSNLYPETRLT